LIVAGLVAALFGVGLYCNPDVEDPCDADPHGCEDSDEDFVIDESCELEGELEVELGQGFSEYTALDDGGVLALHTGFQGGQHAYVGFRVTNADLERYDMLRVDFLLEAFRVCDGPPPEWAHEGYCGWNEAGSRTLVVGGDDTMRVLSNGDIEEYGLILFVDWSALEYRLTLTVDDPCGRSGTVELDLVSG